MDNWQDLLKSEVVASFGGFQVETKTIFLFSGQSMAGKTVTCLHLANEAVKSGKKVLYVDTEEKSIIKRPHPNLFKEFYNQEQEKYDMYFKYYNEFDELEIFNILDKEKPDFIVIDSIYQPFLSKYPGSRTRALKLKEFLTKLRGYIWDHNIGGVITTPVGRVVEPTTKEERLIPLGGEGVKYLSDVKVCIDFVESKDDDTQISDIRFFNIDRQERVRFRIKDGGHLIPL